MRTIGLSRPKSLWEKTAPTKVSLMAAKGSRKMYASIVEQSEERIAMTKKNAQYI